MKTRSKSKKYPDGIIKHTISSFGQNFKVFSKSRENKENKESPTNNNSYINDDYLVPSSNFLNTPLSVSSVSPSPLSSASASSSTSSASTNHDLINTPKSKTLPFPYKPVAYQFADNNNIGQSEHNMPVYNLPKTPPPQDEEIPVQKTRKSFKKLVQKIVDSDILSIKNANSDITDSDSKKSVSSSSTCTTPTTSSHSTTTGTIKTSPKLGRNLFLSKETINSFDVDFTSNNSFSNNHSNTDRNYRMSKSANHNDAHLLISEINESKSFTTIKKPSELYLNDKSLNKKDPGSVCEFLLYKLNQQETHTSNKSPNVKIIETKAKFSSSQQTDVREKNPPLQAEIHDTSNFIEDSSVSPPVAPARNKIKRAIPVNDDLKRVYNNEAIKQAEAVAEVAERHKKYQNENEVFPSSSSSPSSSSAASPNSYKKDQYSTEQTSISNKTSAPKVVYKLDFPIVNHYDNNLDIYKTPQPPPPTNHHHKHQPLESKNSHSKSSNRNGIYIDFDSQDPYEVNPKRIEETQSQTKKSMNQQQFVRILFISILFLKLIFLTLYKNVILAIP